MDMTHGSVMKNGEEWLSNVPMYISGDHDFIHWGGCLHLSKRFGPDVLAPDLPDALTIVLRDGRLGTIHIRKVVSTNASLHFQVLFEGAGPLTLGGV